MTTRGRVARAFYLFAGSALLAWALALLRRGDAAMTMEGSGQILAYGMVLLSFPVGLGVVYAWGQLAAWTGAGLTGAGAVWDLVALWLVLLTVGYLQWFVALPALFRLLVGRSG